VPQVAARLTGTPYVAFTKQPRNNPRGPNRHGRPQTVIVTPVNAPRYTGPVSLLISDVTISAGETFVQAMMDMLRFRPLTSLAITVSFPKPSQRAVSLAERPVGTEHATP